jgi:hypothetical protein
MAKLAIKTSVGGPSALRCPGAPSIPACSPRSWAPKHQPAGSIGLCGLLLCALLQSCTASLPLPTATTGPQPAQPGAYQQPTEPLANAPLAPTELSPPQAADDSVPSAAAHQDVPSSVGASPKVPFEGELGTSESGEVASSDPEGRWLLTCPHDIAAGLPSVPRLVVGKDEYPVQALVDFDPLGRWLVLYIEDGLWLLDATTGKRQALADWDVDAQADASPFAPHRSLAFSSDGKWLAYLKDEGGQRAVVVRDLLTGQQHMIDPGSGHPWRLRFSPGAQQLILTVIASDTNGNGKLDWPVPAASQPPQWRCQSVPGHYDAWLYRGDKATVRTADVTSSRFQEVPGWIAAIGGLSVARDDRGALLLRDMTTQSLLAAEDCQGRVLHADMGRERLLVACADRAVRSRLWLVGPRHRIDTGLSVPTQNADFLPTSTPRLLPLYAGLKVVVVDFDRDQVAELESKDVVVATYGANALIVRGDTLVVADFDSLTAVELASGVEEPRRILKAGAMVVVGDLLIDLRNARLVGSAPSQTQALSSSGALLVPKAPQSDGLPPSGPYHWALSAPIAPLQLVRPTQPVRLLGLPNSSPSVTAPPTSKPRRSW